MTHERFVHIITSDEFTEGEQFICQAHYAQNTLSGFHRALWAMLCVCDESNLKRLYRGWPEHVGAFLAWRQGDLKQRFDGYW